MAGYFSYARQHPLDYLHLPPTLYRPEELCIEPTTYSSEEQLAHSLSQDLFPAGRSLSDIDGDIWRIGPDTAANRATMWSVTSADLVLSRWLGGAWEGAASEIEAVLDETLEEGRTKGLAMGVYPCMVQTTGGTPYYWDEGSGILRPLGATLRFLVQINSIITSRIRRSQHAGVDNPYIPLIVTNGSIFFVVLSRIDIIDGEAYGRLGFTQMESLANYPLRLLFFAHALMHRLNPILPPPPGFSLDEALEASTHPSALLKSQVEAQQALLARKAAEDPDKSGGKGEKLARNECEQGGSRKGSQEGAQAGTLVQKESPLPARFDFVANWWGGGQSRPTTYELVAPGPRFAFQALGSLTASEPYPTILQDRLFVQRGSIFCLQELRTQPGVQEDRGRRRSCGRVSQERSSFEALYRHDDAANFLVGYVGFFESISKSQYCLVTEAGEELNDWTEESAAVIHLVGQLHRHGYVHGDLAERNIVRTPAGLRLIDLGRARKAEGDDCAREMEQLKKVLVDEADWIDYSFLGYYAW